MGTDHPNPWLILMRAGVFGIVMGLVVGALSSSVIELVDTGTVSESVIFATLSGAVVGLLTGLILGLTLVVTGMHHADTPLPRVIVSLMTIFVVGGLAGLLGVKASQVAGLFGVPASIAVWISYPYVVSGRGLSRNQEENSRM